MRHFARPFALATGATLAIAAAGITATATQASETYSPPEGAAYLLLETTSSGGSFSSDGLSDQPIGVAKNCGASTEGDLAILSVTGGDLGFRDNGLGVRAKGPGTNCGQISGAGQSLTLKLGTAFDEKAISRVEVDVESKFACEMDVAYLLDGAPVGSETLTLSTRSDCGADSGSNDNYRKVLPDPAGDQVGALFDEIVFQAAGGGAISLEGGFENPDRDALGVLLETNATIFELVDFTGIDCLESDSSVRDLVLTRTDDSENCQLIPYTLTREGNTIDLIKDIGTQTEATFTLEINNWDPEPSQYPVPATQIDYTPRSDESGLEDMVWCDLDGDGNPVLPDDQIPGGEIDGWCVLYQETNLVGDGMMQVTETLFGKGDPRFNRI
jgi:hypothetical protein